MIKKYVLRFPLMVGSTAEMAVGTQPVETPDDILVLAHKQQERHSQAIYFHLHLAEEIANRLQSAMAHGQPLHEEDLQKVESHIQILNGEHPEQSDHLKNPREFPWHPEQLHRLSALRNFSRVLRTRCSRLLTAARETDEDSSPSSPHTPPPRTKSA